MSSAGGKDLGVTLQTLNSSKQALLKRRPASRKSKSPRGHRVARKPKAGAITEQMKDLSECACSLSDLTSRSSQHQNLALDFDCKRIVCYKRKGGRTVNE